MRTHFHSRHDTPGPRTVFTPAMFGTHQTGVAGAVAAASVTTNPAVVIVPKGDYNIDTTTGSGRTAYSLKITGSNVVVFGEPGARLIAKSGSVARPVLIRDATNITLDGLEIVYDAGADAKNGLVIENSSNVTVIRCTVDGFPVLGISVNEDTSAASLTASTISFSGNRISDSANGFTDAGYANGATITISSSDFSVNEGIRTITAVGAGGAYLDVNGSAFTTESAGTEYTVAVLDSAACNNIRIEHNTVTNCEQAGIITFPKTRSRNLWVIGNKVHACGLTANGGIKAGQGHVNAIIAHNEVSHCGIGIVAANWETCQIVHNQIDNSYDWGVAITTSVHPKYTASFTKLTIAKNEIARTLDYVSGTLFTPSVTNTVKPSLGIIGSSGAAAVNINGLRADAGPIEIDDNGITGCGNALSFDVCLVPFEHVQWTNNRCYNSRMGYVEVLEVTGNTTNTSTSVTSISSTAGWYVGSGIEGPGIQAGTTILDISGTTFTLSLPATATATGVALHSAYPIGLIMRGNTFRDDRGASSTLLGQIYSHRGVIEDNTFEGLQPYGLQLRGDTMHVVDNTFLRVNEVGTANRAPILIDAAGTYHINENYLDNIDGGGVDYLVIATGAGANATGIFERNSLPDTTRLASGLAVVKTRSPFRPTVEAPPKFDDFDSGTTTSASIGALGWAITNGTTGLAAGVASHPGIVQRQTTTTSGTIASLYQRATSATGTFLGSEYFDFTWIFRLNTNDANTTLRVGAALDWAANPPAAGVYLEKLDADTNWFVVARAAGTETRTDTTIATGTGWINLRIRRLSSTSVGYRVNYGTELTIATNVPATALQYGVQIVNSAAASKTVDLDYFEAHTTNISR
jgi:hypothetical protein